jgi:hypothetical protein
MSGLSLVSKAGAAPAGIEGRRPQRLLCVSDLHLETSAGWDLPPADERPVFDVLVVAGDLTVRMDPRIQPAKFVRSHRGRFVETMAHCSFSSKVARLHLDLVDVTALVEAKRVAALWHACLPTDQRAGLRNRLACGTRRPPSSF